MTPEEEYVYNRVATIEEAISDAVSDDEGMLTPKSLEHHLAKRGMMMVGPLSARDLLTVGVLVKYLYRMAEEEK